MLRFLRNLQRQLCSCAILLELTSPIYFYGVLSQEIAVQTVAKNAVAELMALGFPFDDPLAPIRIYPLESGGVSHLVHHAGTWKPGVVKVRMDPQGSLGPEAYLRHELFHEGSARACKGQLPPWAEEAGAIAFSGELNGAAGETSVTFEEVQHLKTLVARDSALDLRAIEVLKRLVARYGWPDSPCAVDSELSKILDHESPRAQPPSYLVTSLQSGRIMSSGGDTKRQLPPGSLLKMLYAAALNDTQGVGEALLRSDTSELLRKRTSFEQSRFEFFLSVVGRSFISQPQDEAFWRSLVGERSTPGGDYLLEFSLEELAKVMRVAFLSDPSRYRELVRNGVARGSTLETASAEDKRLLTQLDALTKTGTVANAMGNPLVGHLLLIWPASRPAYLAIIRAGGVHGAGVLAHARTLIKEWSRRYSGRHGIVRVQLMSGQPRDQWSVREVCPNFRAFTAKGEPRRASSCGEFELVSNVKNSLAKRRISGLLNDDGGSLVLETDSASYADGVVLAEGDMLRGGAAEALRAVVIWNAAYAPSPHRESNSVCDLTHCMVFQGVPGEYRHTPLEKEFDYSVLQALDREAKAHNISWLPFSKGGKDSWQRQISRSAVAAVTGESDVLEMRRVRQRDGSIDIQLVYSETEELVSCELFRSRLRLPSCPDAIREEGMEFVLSGLGEGHGKGLQIEQAIEFSKRGDDAMTILQRSYFPKGGESGVALHHEDH